MKSAVINTTYNITQENVEGMQWWSISRKIKYLAFSKPKENLNYGPYKTLEAAQAAVEQLKAEDQAFEEDWLKNNN